MPRRPKNTSGKKKGPRPFKRSDASVQKWNTLEDIPLDEEDQFHTSRDRILLEGEVDEDLEDDDEVFALKGLEDDESEEELRTGEDDEDELEDAESSKPKPSKSKDKKKKGKKKKKSLFEDEQEDEEEEEEESWGHKASEYYSSNAAQIESDDEEALKMEEEEAMRLQIKARDGMDENDFGLNDPYDEQPMEIDDLAEPAPVVLPALPNDKKSLLRHLEKNNPEALALARDWEDAVQSLPTVRLMCNKIWLTDCDSPSLGMMHLYYQTLVTYATTLTFYLYLRAKEKYAQRPEMLRAHPIMTQLLTLKQSLATLEELDFFPADSEDEFDEDEDEDEEGVELDFDELDISEEFAGRIGRLEPQELSELLKDAIVYRDGRRIEAEQQDTLQKRPKKKRKTAKDSSAPVQPIFDLVEPVFKSTNASAPKTSTQDSVSDVYGEALSLQHADAADKSARRKSLRFHTSKIESAGARRQGARQALGGDDDIPYRERRKEKDARMLKEAKDRVKNQGGADLDDAEPEPRSNNEDEDEDADGYYNLVKKQSKQRKEKKRADYETKQAELRQNLVEETADGPRSLTKAILTNRGLTPHRPKSSRNPRVRKREKYEKAKKKVASQKATFKGGLSGSGGYYEGEKSGISKVVKGVRLA
ncbi:Sas10 C-terminal domain-containing protein [Amanita rubescens]|nr:Sas10 C-terminal domain-containing protein [Amanita rubescens]